MKYLAPSSVPFTFYLAAAVAIAPLSTDMYLSTFPAIAHDFKASAADVQLTLSTFTFGIGICQLLYGPVTDRFGRKPVLLFGLFLYVIASVGCFMAGSIHQLIGFRFLQALGICASVVIPRAMVRDLFLREAAAKQLSRMGTIMGLAPAIAPVMGGYLAIIYGWQAIFVFLALFAILTALTTLFLVGESIPKRDHNALRPAHILRNFRALLMHREFLGFSLAAGLCFGGLFSFLSGSPLVLIEVFDIKSEHFGYFFSMVVVGFMSGTLTGPVMSARRDIYFSVRIGTFAAAIGGGTMMLLAFAGVNHIAAVVGPMILYTFGMGVVLPQSQAGGMAPFPEKAGAASALMGFMMLGLAALLGYLVAYFYDGTQISMTTSIGIMGLTSALSYRLVLDRRIKN
ncbi:MAG: Bcr/CflA family efflux MFS transporter [Alphaproteobacteria bacterium]|nr:MAG: Bcr/CflA family efflux MFS transporter [Alphaproteobacteria bacterium]